MKLNCPQLPVSSQFICTVVLFCYITVLLFEQVHTIGCFVCSSINHSNPDCEDVFNATGKYYKKDCMAGRKLRDGLFPGTNCIKLKAEIREQNYTILVRDCAVDSGGVNSESEIGRESHCWMVRRIKYEDQYGPKYMSGCSLACDTDGCNHSNSIQASYWLLVPFLGYSLATRITSSV